MVTRPPASCSPPFAALDRLCEITLDRLDQTETALLAGRAGGRTLESAVAERLWADTAGNPLFVVEAIRSGWDPAGDGADSPRVQAVLSARLGQLSPGARQLCGLAAAVGRDFTSDLLAAAGGLEADTVASAIDELWRRRIISESGFAAYDFSHEKLRAAAYATLGPATRRQVHERVALVLDGRADSDRRAAQIADHLVRAGRPAQAAERYRVAAAAAQRLHANVDAVRLLELALQTAAGLPASADRNQLELSVLSALPAPLASVDGYASQRLTAVHERAIALAAASGHDLAASLLWSIAFTSLVREDFGRARTVAAELHERGVTTGDDVLVVQGACLLGLAAFWRNELPESLDSLQEVVDRYRPDQRHIHLQRFGQDPLVMALARIGNVRFLLGDPVGAIAARDQASTTAAEIRQPLTTGAALVFGALLAIDMGDTPGVRRYAEDLDAAADRAPQVAVFATALAGYVDALDGRAATGCERIAKAIGGLPIPPPAPGMGAILQRIRLAAGVAANDHNEIREAANELLVPGGTGAVWADVARKARVVADHTDAR